MIRRTDKWWKAVAAAALLLAAFSLLASVLLFGKIQASREESVRLACRDTNARNRAAIPYFLAFPQPKGQPKRTPEEQSALIHSFTDVVVGPVRDCDKRVQQLVR